MLRALSSLVTPVVCALIAVAVALGLNAPAHAQDLSAVDAYVDAAPESTKESVPALAAYLARAGETDLERARAVFRWLTRNIEYDVAGLMSGEYGDVSPGGVLRSGSAVCSGYAGLARALGDEMGLEIEEVSGWSKGYGYTVGQRFDGPTNHAWNAVRIDGAWHLMDPTWGAGYLGEGSRFVQRFQEHYFLTDPEVFLFDHLPEDDRWQLLDRPLSHEAYSELVYLRPHFFTNDLEVRSHDRVVIETGARAAITLGAPRDVALVARLSTAGGRDLDRSRTFVQRDGDEVRIAAVLPEAGEYVLRVFAKPAAREGSYDWALDYRVRASDGEPDGSFPTVFQSFIEREAVLDAPLGGTLARGRSHPVRIRVPGALEVAAVVEGQWVHLTRAAEAPDFAGTVVAGGDEVTLFARFEEGASFSGLLRYTVR